jgi:hypothetical protein
VPTLISRGTAAARAFGFSGSNSGQLYTQTFTSNGTFTPLAGVTNVTTLVGQGGSAQGDYPEFQNWMGISQVIDNGFGTGTSPLPIPWADIASIPYDVYNTFNAGGDQSGYFYDITRYDFVSNGVTDTYTLVNLGAVNFPYYTYATTWQIGSTGTAPNPPSGLAYYTDVGEYRIQGMFQQYGNNGTNSSALGYTFPAATLSGSYPNRASQTATPVTYSNIAVTPGTNYPIVVGAGGSVAISYIIP